MNASQIICLLILFFLALAGTRVEASVTKNGLILHLDAAEQIKSGGTSSSNSIWKNLANQPDNVAGSCILHNFAGTSGWMGDGSQADPYALRFDGRLSYAVGPGDLELPEITIEAWARVDAHTLRGATLIGNDFGMGGISLQIQPVTESPVILTGGVFTPVDAETPARMWQQVALALKDGVAEVYVNGTLAGVAPVDRHLQKDHAPFYMLGAARHVENDYVEADGLIGALAIIRVYDRALSASEIAANFESDKGRFPINSALYSTEPVNSMPVPSVPVLGPTPPARCVKWDYYNSPVRVTGSGGTGWPYGVRWAFDGYPTAPDQPYVRNYWKAEAPSAGKPSYVNISYRRPVAVTRYIHYYDRSGATSAWRQVEILTSDDNLAWIPLQSYDLPLTYPQVLPIDKPKLARYYKIVVKSLAEGSTGIATHEIETYYGATIGKASLVTGADGYTMNVRVVSPDTALKGASIRLVSSRDGGRAVEAALPAIAKAGGSSVGTLKFARTDVAGPTYLELHAGGCLIDRVPVVVPQPDPEAATQNALTAKTSKCSVRSSGVAWEWTAGADGLHYSAMVDGAQNPVIGTLQVVAGDKPCPLVFVGSPSQSEWIAARIPGGLLKIAKSGKSAGDLGLQCTVVPDCKTSAGERHFCDFEFRLGVDDPKIMFRPHIDWYTAEHGPNVPQYTNAHHSATRMLCVQAGGNTVSLVPDTDNLVWGFNQNNEIVARFHVPCDEMGGWSPIDEAPRQFTLTIPVRNGDWWDAYRHVVEDIFKFDQPRQWTMPVTQMQMLSARYTMRYEVWSEKWQTVRSHPWFDFFYNFYGTTYTLPTLYSWYLATDDPQAKVKAEKVTEWLLSVQQKEGPTAGAWFSQYCVEGNPPQLVGRDQAWNRWVTPHSTGTAAKTLLWYWEASGKVDSRVFGAAKQGCDWLVAIQRPDGGWPYALDLNGKPITDLPDAGQIWCTWALWKMYQYTGESKYKVAAEKSRDLFRKTFMDAHRYMGYWEDVSGASGKVQRSWEGYEPAIAALVFVDMGDKKLAIDAAKDAATWSWTRVISTRQYETCYGETTEQSLCGPSQAQSPMTGVGLESVYQLTGDKLWSDFSGAIKAMNFAADPDQAYGFVATGGWDDPTTGVVGPPYDNVRPWVTPNNSKGDEYGRQVWNEWESCQFAWLALEWLVREGNIRAPQYFKIDPNTYRGTVLGASGRVKMPEEKCDVVGIDHHDINWVGYSNDTQYALLVMNHKEKLTVLVRPHEAHLDVLSKVPRVLVGSGKTYKEITATKNGEYYSIVVPERASALLVWDRIR